MEILSYVLGGTLILFSLLILKVSAKTKKLIHIIAIVSICALITFSTGIESIVLIFIMFVIYEYFSSIDTEKKKYVAKRTELYLRYIRVLMLVIFMFSILVFSLEISDKQNLKEITYDNEFVVIVVLIMSIIDALKRRRKWKY